MAAVRSAATWSPCTARVGRPQPSAGLTAAPGRAGTAVPGLARRRPPARPRPPAASATPPGRTRLATRLTTVPRRIDLYFEGRPLRRALWTAIAFATGFYAGNTVSLSFGALAVNDVVAAAVTVAGYEVASSVYHRAPRKTLRLVFMNAFKMGVVVSLISDAFKLAG